MPITKICPKYNLLASVYEFDSLGSGFPLYYQLKRFNILVYFWMFILVSIPCMSINTNARNGNKWGHRYETSTLVDTSIGNHGKSPHHYKGGFVTAQLVLNLLMIFSILIGTIVFKRLQNKRIAKVQENNITPSAFALMVKNLPLNKTKEEVKDWFNGFFDQPCVQYVNF